MVERFKGPLLLAAIFLLGMVAGAATFHLGQRSVLGGPAGARRVHRELLRELELRPEQQEQIERLIHERHEQIGEWLEQTRTEIRALLDPEQQEKFDRLHPPDERRRPHRGRLGPFRSR